MKKSLIIVISIIVVTGGIGYLVYSQGYLEKIFPGLKRDNYEYKSEELKKMSEEAGINLEKGMVVEEPTQEIAPIYEKQKEEELMNRNSSIYKGTLIINESNNKEWTVRVGIATEADKKYGIWKQEGRTELVFMKELTSSGYEEWEYKSEGEQELKGRFYIGTISTGNVIIDTLYTIQK